MSGKENLRDVLALTPRETAGQIRRVAELLIGNTIDPSSPEMVAAFKIMEGLSSAGVKIGEALQGVIFEERKEKPQEEVVTVEAPLEESVPAEITAEEKEKKPKTFGELLRVKINEVLPDGQTQFKAGALAGVLGSRKGVKIALMALGLQGGRSFDRATAIDVAEKVLTTPRSDFIPQEAYRHSGLCVAFHPSLRASTLNEWSQQIGYDWKANPRVDLQTALAIRGLTYLRKLTASRRPVA